MEFGFDWQSSFGEIRYLKTVNRRTMEASVYEDLTNEPLAQRAKNEMKNTLEAINQVTHIQFSSFTFFSQVLKLFNCT